MRECLTPKLVLAHVLLTCAALTNPTDEHFTIATDEHFRPHLGFPRRAAENGKTRSIMPEMDRLLPPGDMMSSALTEFRPIVMTALDGMDSIFCHVDVFLVKALNNQQPHSYLNQEITVVDDELTGTSPNVLVNLGNWLLFMRKDGCKLARLQSGLGEMLNGAKVDQVMRIMEVGQEGDSNG